MDAAPKVLPHPLREPMLLGGASGGAEVGACLCAGAVLGRLLVGFQYRPGWRKLPRIFVNALFG